MYFFFHDRLFSCLVKPIWERLSCKHWAKTWCFTPPSGCWYHNTNTETHGHRKPLQVHWQYRQSVPRIVLHFYENIDKIKQQIQDYLLHMHLFCNWLQKVMISFIKTSLKYPTYQVHISKVVYINEKSSQLTLSQTYLEVNIFSLTVFDNLWYVETTTKLQPAPDTQTQSISVCPIQTHLFQLPAPSGERERGRCTAGCVRQVNFTEGQDEWLHYENGGKLCCNYILFVGCFHYVSTHSVWYKPDVQQY